MKIQDAELVCEDHDSKGHVYIYELTKNQLPYFMLEDNSMLVIGDNDFFEEDRDPSISDSISISHREAEDYFGHNDFYSLVVKRNKKIGVVSVSNKTPLKGLFRNNP